MKNIAEFKASFDAPHPDKNLSVQLKALWYDGKGDWHKAHQQVDHLNDRASAQVHAYLHRKEGDLWNAGYWYNKAEEQMPKFTLEEEWEKLVLKFL